MPLARGMSEKKEGFRCEGKVDGGCSRTRVKAHRGAIVGSRKGMKTLIFTLSAALLLAIFLSTTASGCRGRTEERGEENGGPGSPEVRELPMRTLAHGMISQYGRGDEFPPGEDARPECEVITRPEELEMLLRVAQFQEPIPPVDLERQVVLAVLQGLKKTGGYAISISRVSQKGTLVEVEVMVVEPEPGSITIQILTSPYHLVCLDREAFKPRGELRFVFLDERGNLLEEVLAEV